MLLACYSFVRSARGGRLARLSSSKLACMHCSSSTEHLFRLVVAYRAMSHLRILRPSPVVLSATRRDSRPLFSSLDSPCPSLLRRGRKPSRRSLRLRVFTMHTAITEGVNIHTKPARRGPYTCDSDVRVVVQKHEQQKAQPPGKCRVWPETISLALSQSTDSRMLE